MHRATKRIIYATAVAIVLLLATVACLYLTGYIRVYGIRSGYAYLSREERARIVFSRNKLCDLDEALDRVHREKKILCVNGAELRVALASKPKALVYIFTEGCTSSSCLPLSTIGAYAHKIGAAPYYVAIDLMPELLRRTEPILSIDYTHYGTKWHDSFYEAFVKDLTGRSTDEEHFNLVLFERGRIVRTFTTEELLQ
nr:hypothetical protein [uncultured Porphyromonas sp.]